MAPTGTCPVVTEPSGVDDSPLLSIAIPTWNRAESLRKTLASVVDQAAGRPWADRIEIVVSDNASTPETEQVVAEVARSTDVRVNYTRNMVNIGGFRNALQVLRMSQGRFWMFFGDDDLVAPGALRRLVEILDAEEDAAVVTFGAPRPGTYFGGLESPSRLTVDTAAREVFYELGNAGRLAVRTNLAQSVLEERGESFFRTVWPQTEIAFLAAARSGSAAPVLVVPIASSVSEAHADNTAYTSYYLLKTTVVDLYRSAADIAPFVSADFLGNARTHIFGRRRMSEIVISALSVGGLSDTDDDLALAAATVKAGYDEADPSARMWFMTLYVLTRMPRALKRSILVCGFMLKHGFREGRRTMSRVRAEADARRASRVSGSSRAYRPEDL